MNRLKHQEFVQPATKRHRVLFAVIRIAEVSLAVLGLILIDLALSRPSSPGSTTRELYWIGWSTPRLFVAIGGALLVVAALVQIISRPIKRRWRSDLRGWIE
jgi:hypothetical protein